MPAIKKGAKKRRTSKRIVLRSTSTIKVPLASLKEHPRNYRKHPDDQVEHICESIREHGMYRDIITAKDRKTVLAGHGVRLACIKLGLRTVPIVPLPIAPNSKQALKVLAADNEVGRRGERDDRALSQILKEIFDDSGPTGLLGTGYDELMLASLAMVARPASELQTMDKNAEWAGLPGYEPEGTRKELLLYFETDEERQQLCDQLGLKPHNLKGKFSAWWPPRDKDDQSAVEFTDVP